MSILAVNDLTIRFGGVMALANVSFDVAEGEVCSLIGPNGAGKTTLFNCVSRIYQPDRGDIVFAGQSLMRKRAHQLAALGITRTFQNLALFPSMDVLTNVMVGLHSRGSVNFLSGILPRRAAMREERRLREQAMDALDALGLASLAATSIVGLPFATLKRVELARALVAAPRLLLLDEPAAGLTFEEVGRLGALIRKIRDERGLSVLLVEHNMDMVMTISERVVVLDSGSVIAVGAPQQVRQDARVIEAYLGTDAGALA